MSISSDLMKQYKQLIAERNPDLRRGLADTILDDDVAYVDSEQRLHGQPELVMALDVFHTKNMLVEIPEQGQAMQRSGFQIPWVSRQNESGITCTGVDQCFVSGNRICFIARIRKDVITGKRDGTDAPARGWSIESWKAFWEDPRPDVARTRVPSVVAPTVKAYWPHSDRPATGPEQYCQRVVRILELVPDLRLRMDEVASSGDVTFISWTATGTGRDGVFQFAGVDRIKMQAGLVVENRIFSDHEIFRELERSSANVD